MAINVSVQHNGGFLPDIILLTQCYYHRGTHLNAMQKFCTRYLQPMIPPKRFDMYVSPHPLCINVEIENVPRICSLTDSVDRSCFGS